MLFRDGSPIFRDGSPVFVEEGAAGECECCGETFDCAGFSCNDCPGDTPEQYLVEPDGIAFCDGCYDCPEGYRTLDRKSWQQNSSDPPSLPPDDVIQQISQFNQCGRCGLSAGDVGGGGGGEWLGYRDLGCETSGTTKAGNSYFYLLRIYTSGGLRARFEIWYADTTFCESEAGASEDPADRAFYDDIAIDSCNQVMEFTNQQVSGDCGNLLPEPTSLDCSSGLSETMQLALAYGGTVTITPCGTLP